MRGCCWASQPLFSELAICQVKPVPSNYVQLGTRHDRELRSVFGRCSTNIYGGLCPYCVLFLTEGCHLNERIVIKLRFFLYPRSLLQLSALLSKAPINFLITPEIH